MRGMACLFVALAMLSAGCGGNDLAESHRAPRQARQLVQSQAAPAAYGTVVQQLYIAYFGRPADSSGLTNFSAALAAAGAPSDIQSLNAAYDTNAAVRALVDAFGVSAESNALYAGDTEEFVEAIYRNVLNRAAAQDGKRFWSDAIDYGGLTKGHAALSIMAGALLNTSAQGAVDAAVVNRKTAIAADFTAALDDPARINAYRGAAAAAAARTLLASVSATTDTAAFQGAIEATIAGLLPSTLAPCPADIAAPLFGTSPVAPADFIAFRPLGFLSTPIHMFPAKHSSFSMTPIGQAAAPKPVVAPGRGFVTEIYEASFSTGGTNYQVFLRPCLEVRAYFGHLATISDKLLAAFNAGTPSCNAFDDGSSTVTTCRRENLSVLLEEGEQFGTGPDTAGVDFGTLDFRRTPAAFADATHYDHYYLYYTSPLDYFTAATRAAIEGKTGDVFGTALRTAAPVGGTYMQDIPGTAQGNWFLPGKYHSNTTDLSIFLGLAHDYVDPSQPIMAIGTSVPGMSMGLYAYTVAQSGKINRNFDAVAADGNVYCFDNFLQGRSPGGMPLTRLDGVLLMALPDAASLKVEMVAAATCAELEAWAFSANAANFVR